VTSPRTSFEIIRKPAAMRAAAEDLRRDGRRICVVPTMGFLHDGHVALLRDGRARADVLIFTLFVNPTQFGPNEDLSLYPRDEEGDLAKARAAGADIAFCPDPSSMYGPRHQTNIEVGPLSQPLCGVSRPGHFRGVATVVAKLFNLTMPHVAIFGQKDFQQLAVIRQMVADLDFGVEIIGAPIVREPDGLAMSSRNAYLTAGERAQATCLHRGLEAARAAFAAGERQAAKLVAAARAPIEAAPLCRIDYLELRDALSLEPIEAVERSAVLAMAVYIGRARLIDNTVLTPPT
jgi:pantoate--beta-alanine ligase